MTSLATLLARIGWSPTELAARLQVLPGTAQQWASGRRDPPPAVLERLEPVARAVERSWRTPEGWGGARRRGQRG